MLPVLKDFDFVLALATKGDKFGLLVLDEKEATGVELDLEQAEDLVRRLADLLFTSNNEPTKAKETTECQ